MCAYIVFCPIMKLLEDRAVSYSRCSLFMHSLLVSLLTHYISFVIPQINTHSISTVICTHVQGSEKCESSEGMFIAEMQQEETLREPTRGWRPEGVVRTSSGGSSSGTSWSGFESRFWHLLVGQPQASHLRLLKFVPLSQIKKTECTRTNCF